MSTSGPSIEDLLKKDKDTKIKLDKKFKVNKTLTQVNRQFEETEVARKAAELGYQYIDLDRFPFDVEALALISKEEAVQAQALPFHHEGGEVRLGVVDPTSPDAAAVRKKLEDEKYTVRLFMVSKDSFNQGVENYARVVRHVGIDQEHIVLTAAELGDRSKKLDGLLNAKEMPKVDASETLSDVLAKALSMGASDIHIEPEAKVTKLRLRLDGVLSDTGEVNQHLAGKLVDRIKILSKMKLNITNKAQDGRFSIKLDSTDVDFRVSLLPSAYGEGVVIRILKQQGGLTLDDLGIVGLARKKLDEALQKTTGLILTTGPTGSGKTTTLYSVLTLLNEPGVKIITVEDPVEYKIEGISQTPISEGLTFASALRAVLRQDPDIVMVGEIRDHETADIAVQASLTGHIVLSTLHTNDAVGAVGRLLDLDIKPFLITGSVRIVMAQRLVRRICQNCKVEDKPDEKILAKVKAQLTAIPESSGEKAPANPVFYVSHGCDQCHGGYKGQIGIYEVFSLTEGMEKLILREAASSALRQQAIQDGMVTMVQDGLLKALRGVTDIYEVFRVAE